MVGAALQPLINPFTPKSDQLPCSVTSNIASHCMENLAFHIVYSDKRLLYYQFSLPPLCISLLEGWENVLVLNLGVKELNTTCLVYSPHSP